MRFELIKRRGRLSKPAITINGQTFERITFQHSLFGGIDVHGWGTYPKDSVLAGQPSKTFLDNVPTMEDAIAKYPGATRTSSLTEPRVSLAHLPGEDEMVPGGALPDDWTD